jgi:cytoskeletal protein CcmA (bactofilin family)
MLTSWQKGFNMITIPANTTLIGEIRSAGRIRIEGRVEGTGDIDGLLLLTNECVWKGKLTADVVIIEGTVEGEIIAREKLEIHAKSNINGKVTSPLISIAEGAVVNGTLKMGKPEAPIGLIHKQKEQLEATAKVEEADERKIVGE